MKRSLSINVWFQWENMEVFDSDQEVGQLSQQVISPNLIEWNSKQLQSVDQHTSDS